MNENYDSWTWVSSAAYSGTTREIVDLMWQKTMKGESEVTDEAYTKALNKEALWLYNLKSLSGADVEELKKIIEICNVFYNRTDISVLPIEDGFYDLLLEKYKQYDPNFQVGSAVINMKTSSESLKQVDTRKVIKPISFFESINFSTILL